MAKINKNRRSHLKKDHLNWNKNKPLGINHLSVLFDNASTTMWYINSRKKIFIINVFCWINKKEHLRLQKEIFINNFNQYYNFEYNFVYENDEFNQVYNAKMTVFKIFKPY